MHIIDQEPKNNKGELHGEWIRYYDNGNLRFREKFVHGIAHGFRIGYTEDNIIEYFGCRNMGRRVGYWYWLYKKHYYLCLI